MQVMPDRHEQRSREPAADGWCCPSQSSKAQRDEIRRVVDDEQTCGSVSAVGATVCPAGRERERVALAGRQWPAAVLKLVFDGAADDEPGVSVEAPLLALCPGGVFDDCPAMAFDVGLPGAYSGNVPGPVDARELDRDVFDGESEAGSILWHDRNVTAVEPTVGPSRRTSVVQSAHPLVTRPCHYTLTPCRHGAAERRVLEQRQAQHCRRGSVRTHPRLSEPGRLATIGVSRLMQPWRPSPSYCARSRRSRTS
jgi:hypothetical protein